MLITHTLVHARTHTQHLRNTVATYSVVGAWLERFLIKQQDDMIIIIHSVHEIECRSLIETYMVDFVQALEESVISAVSVPVTRIAS